MSGRGGRAKCRAMRASALFGASVRDGARALRKAHRNHVDGAEVVRCSVDFDEATKKSLPMGARYDYVLAAVDRLEAIEVHPTAPKEVDRVIAKKRATERVLAREMSGETIAAWHWMVPPKGQMFLLRDSAEARRLATAGVQFPVRRVRVG